MKTLARVLSRFGILNEGCLEDRLCNNGHGIQQILYDLVLFFCFFPLLLVLQIQNHLNDRKIVECLLARRSGSLCNAPCSSMRAVESIENVKEIVFVGF